jgi:surfeit locus 1 family protein
MYRFAARPKWILSHVFVLALVITMILAGFWQLDRLQQKKDRNALITDRLDEPTAEIATLTSPGADLATGADLQYRRATAVGEFVPAEEVLVRNRTLNGRPGYWVLTPLALDDGGLLVVDRGWIPLVEGEGIDVAPPAPTGEVKVTGVLRRTEEAAGLESADPADGELTIMNRPDLGRLQQQLDEPLLPVVMQIVPDDTRSTPVLDPPLPIPLPALDEGPHLSYAVQWFTFSTIGVVGYLLFLRKHARDPDRVRTAAPSLP